jgi:hypothetical protein
MNSDESPSSDEVVTMGKPLISALTRRDVLKLAGAGIMSNLAAPQLRAQSGRTKNVIIAGAGIGGLCL